MTGFFAGVVAGMAAVGLLIIVLAPSRRVRAEARLDQEVETRLLLGMDPDVVDETEPSPAQDEEHPADFGAAELQALRQLGSEQQSSSGRRRAKKR